jgi:Cys-rich four helix bundle protein (predicted Tat secretion target)
MEDQAPLDLGLGRRALLIGAAATAAGAALAGVTNAAEDSARPSASKLAELAAKCTERGEECLAHCLDMFGGGDTSLAACARSVHEMMAVCSAYGRLAQMDSKHLRSLGTACAEICEACEKECRKHAKEHETCRSCADACKDLAAAIRSRSA